MRIVRIECPDCGKSFQIDTIEEKVACLYCGHEHQTDRLLDHKDEDVTYITKEAIKKHSKQKIDHEHTVFFDEVNNIITWETNSDLSDYYEIGLFVRDDDNIVTLETVYTSKNFYEPTTIYSIDDLDNFEFTEEFKYRIKEGVSKVEIILAEVRVRNVKDGVADAWRYSDAFHIKIVRDNKEESSNIDISYTPTENYDGIIIKKILDLVMYITTFFLLCAFVHNCFDMITSTNNIYKLMASCIPEMSGESVIGTKDEANNESLLHHKNFITQDVNQSTSFYTTNVTTSKISVKKKGNMLIGREPIGISVDWINDIPLYSKRKIIITEIQKDGPSYGKGLYIGDVITAINGKRITNEEGLNEAMENHYIGEDYILSIDRNINNNNVQITVPIGVK